MRTIESIWLVAASTLLGCSSDHGPAVESPTGGADHGAEASAGSSGSATTAGNPGEGGGHSNSAGSSVGGAEAVAGMAPTAGNAAGGAAGACNVSTGGCGSAGMAGQGLAGAGGGGTTAKLARVLVYNKVDINPDTNELRGHTGGGEDEKLLKSLGAEHEFEVVVTDKASDFNADQLATFDVVAFASPDYATQELTQQNRAALEAFVRGGGGWVGWHYALWVEKGWPFLKVLGGGVVVKAHVGGVQASTYTTVTAGHPIARGLPAIFDVNDDFLAFDGGSPEADPNITILATAALTATPGGSGHPVVWAHDVGQGRAFYSMLGHGADDFKAPYAKVLMYNALRWVARVE